MTSSRDQLERNAMAMADSLAYRGPDDHGIWSDMDAGIALTHRRLSIVDLSPAGHQPMISADGRFIVTYNGEIYNCQDLRPELNGPRSQSPERNSEAHFRPLDRSWADDLLTESRLRQAGLLDARVRQIWDAHLNGRAPEP